MNTVFKVNGQGYQIKGVGQATVSAALKQFKGQKVILVGFMREGDSTIIKAF